MRALLLAAALLAAGCPAGLEAQSHISKLRVLAVRADPPELIVEQGAPLPKTKLTALAVDPSGAAIEVRFALCADLSGVPSPTLPCPGSAGLELPDATLDLSDPRILALAASLDAGVTTDVANLEQPLLIGFTASTATESLSGFQTITLKTRGPANRNPQLTSLDVPDAHPGETVRLTPSTAPKDDPSEHYLFSFFATDGSISSLHSTDTTSTGQSAPTWVDWTAPAHAGQVQLWVVLRDGRGGVDWLARPAQVK